MATANEVSTLRLNIIRAGYLLLFVGVASSEWPGLIHHEGWPYTHGIAIWLLAIALPLWLSHEVDPATQRMTITCLAAMVIVPLLIPWPYLFANYVTKRGDRWR